MNLNMNDLLVNRPARPRGDDHLGGTDLRLDCFGYGPRASLSAEDDGCRLVLGLGPTPSSSAVGGFCGAEAATKSSRLKNPSNGVDLDSGRGLKLGHGRDGGDLELSIAPSSQSSISLFDQAQQATSERGERSSSETAVDGIWALPRRKFGGYTSGLIMAPGGSESRTTTQEETISGADEVSESSLWGDEVGGPDARRRHHRPKKCRFNGCPKGARGASGLCIAHGGGQRCQKPGCNKGAECRTAYCKAHGGGRRCQQLGCTKSAEGKTELCIAHGGGSRCGHPGCRRAARGRSGFCIRHGGGKRCRVDGCARSAEGKAGLCISHGGGRRCQFPGCGKGAQGSTMHCKAHGGGRRCVFEGCTKGAEGSTALCKAHGGGKRCLFEGGGVCPKSVHGGTDYCVAHGGGKRCAVPGCTRSARGRTDCCVKHGGGRRCRSEGCGKSAQGSTDFCKAHGGGKRCSWATGCEKFARGRSGLCAAHGSMAANQAANQAEELFRGVVVGSASATTRSSMDNGCSSAISTLSGTAESPAITAGRRQLLLSLPPWMRPASGSSDGGVDDAKDSGRNSLKFALPEGRVHGGGLLSLFGGDLRNAIDADLGPQDEAT